MQSFNVTALLSGVVYYTVDESQVLKTQMKLIKHYPPDKSLSSA